MLLVAKLMEAISNLEISEEERAALLSTCEELRGEMKLLNATSEKDVLGDWPNRRGLFRQAERIFSEYDREIYPSVSVAFIDLDKFKAINDIYGHRHGDEVIKKIAEIIYSSIRKTDVYGRLSGDEFVIVLPGSTLEAAEKILSRIKEKFCDVAFSFNTERIPVSLTYGLVSTETVSERTFERLLCEADEMMNSKKGDRSR